MAKNLASLYESNLNRLTSQAKRNNEKELKIGDKLRALAEKKNKFLKEHKEELAALNKELEELRAEGAQITKDISELEEDMKDLQEKQ